MFLNSTHDHQNYSKTNASTSALLNKPSEDDNKVSIDKYRDTTFDQALCLAIRKRPNLYNSKCKRKKKYYNDDLDWLNISDEMKLSVDECKIRYQKLRRLYVKQKKCNDSGEYKKAKRHELEVLNFLDPYIVHRKSRKSQSRVSQNLQFLFTTASSCQDNHNDNEYSDREIEISNSFDDQLSKDNDASDISGEHCKDENDAHEDISYEMPFTDLTNTLTVPSTRTNSDIRNQTQDLLSGIVLDKPSKYKCYTENIALTNQVMTRLWNMEDINQRNKLIVDIIIIIFSPQLH